LLKDNGEKYMGNGMVWKLRWSKNTKKNWIMNKNRNKYRKMRKNKEDMMNKKEMKKNGWWRGWYKSFNELCVTIRISSLGRCIYIERLWGKGWNGVEDLKEAQIDGREQM
jgi:hypothetical protein